MNQYLKFAIGIAAKAGAVQLKYYCKNFSISHKGKDKSNLVTEVDHASEKIIVEAIKKRFPTHCVLSEESGDCGMKQTPYRWIVDPLDGTTNYAHGYNFFCVSIGLEVKGEIVVGVIYAPYLKELFYAQKGAGAFLNGKKIQVSKIKKIESALLATGLIHGDKNQNLKHFQHFLGHAQAIRRCGAAALDLCYTAVGRLDGFWEPSLWPWDVAAGKLIVEEAGGKITAMDGSPFKVEAKSLLATNGLIHKEMEKYFKVSKR